MKDVLGFPGGVKSGRAAQTVDGSGVDVVAYA